MAHENVNCDSCGALLEIAPSGKFVTCGYCGTALAIRRTGTSVYTEPSQARGIAAESLSPQRAHTSPDRQMELNRLENQLNRLDIDWDREKETYMVTGKYGHRSLPTKGGGIGMAIVAAVAGIIWSVVAFGVTSGFTFSLSEEVFGPPPIIRILFPLFGLVFAAAGIIWGVQIANKADRYQRVHEKYRRERERLRDQLRQLGG